MVHELKLRSVYFDLIKNGVKIYEGRLNDEKRQQIDVGDIITFKREPELKDAFNAEVKDLIYFNSFEEMANTLPLDKVGFEKETPDEVVGIYHQFYSLENEKKYGVVAIKVEVLKWFLGDWYDKRKRSNVCDIN